MDTLTLKAIRIPAYSTNKEGLTIEKIHFLYAIGIKLIFG